VAELWKPAHDEGAEGPRLGSEPQTGATADAGRQSPVRAEEEVRGDETDSAHGAEDRAKPGGINDSHDVDQLWVADITDIGLEEESWR
jgi:hypothetical protein